MENYFFKITNDFKLSDNKQQCNPFNNHNNFGNYFETCSPENKSAYWGSDKPTADNCLKPQVGQPCHALWNNLTKRKSIVDYNR